MPRLPIIVIGVAVGIGTVLALRDPVSPDASDAETVLEKLPVAQTEPGVGRSGSNQTVAPSGADEDTSYRSEECLDADQLTSHEWVVADRQRLAGVLTDGDAVAAYRNVDIDTVRQMAEQGDSAAMLVLGAAALARAMEADPDSSVPYLLGEDFTFLKPLSSTPQAQMHLVEAGSWYYQAALHGRLAALTYYGDVLTMQDATPVSLGWLNQATFDAVPEDEKIALMPSSIYLALPFDIAPQMLTGTYGSALAVGTPTSDLQLTIRQQLLVDFYRSQNQAGLPEIEVEDGNTPDVAELNALACEPFLDESRSN